MWIGGCAFTVLTAISFHFVTSFAACANVGTASTTAATNTASHLSRPQFIARSVTHPGCFDGY